jgi:hypothetical protein
LVDWSEHPGAEINLSSLLVKKATKFVKTAFLFDEFLPIQ